MLPTPAARDGDQRGASDPVRRRAGGHQVNLDDAVNAIVRPELVPPVDDARRTATPVAADPAGPVPEGCVTLAGLAPTPPDLGRRARRDRPPGRSKAALLNGSRCGALPTPERSVLCTGLSPNAWGPPGDTRRARCYFRRKYRPSTARRTVPSALPADSAGPVEHGTVDWGDYAAAVHRWELVTGRTAPHPTPPGRHGLAPAFVEWLMGLPVGWVTADRLGLPRTAQLRALGNGVIPAQAAHAVRLLLDDLAALHRHPFCPPVAAPRRRPVHGPARRPGGPTRPPTTARASTAAAHRRRVRPHRGARGSTG